jgi:hypothetical protein
MGRTPEVIGKVVSSSNATVEGSALLPNGTILSGDAVTVGEGGLVILSFSPTGRAALAAATRVRFIGGKGNIEARLLSGTLSVERESQDTFVVTTSTHQFAPQGERKAEFRVALLPDKSTLVETQHGKMTITETRSGESYTLAEGLLAEIPALASGFQGQNEEPASVIGKVAAAAAATRNGTPLSPGETVLANDLISTGESGSAIIQTSSTTQVTLNANTSGRFTRIVERVWLRLQNGTVVVESTGRSYVLIATTRFNIQPNSPAPSKIYVGVLADNSTYIESLTGDVTIEDTKSEQSYLLPAGQSTMVPANATSLPGLQPLPSTAPLTPLPTPPPTPPPSTPPSKPQPTAAAKPHAHTGIIILGVAGAVGAAAAAALAGGGGGGHPPVSLSSP